LGSRLCFVCVVLRNSFFCSHTHFRQLPQLRDNGGFGGPATAFSACLARHKCKFLPLRSGWLLFCSPNCALFALLSCFCLLLVSALTNLFFLAFFLSLHFVLVVGCLLFPVHRCSYVPATIPRLWQSSHSSASTVLPFVSLLGGATQKPMRSFLVGCWLSLFWSTESYSNIVLDKFTSFYFYYLSNKIDLRLAF
jgi:hypothetical protein